MEKAANFDEYLEGFPPLQQRYLKLLRKIITTAAPQAVEKISYGMPAFYQDKNLVYFAAYKNHIGFYPHAEAIVVFAGELQEYKTSKGAIQFPLDKPLPAALIKKIVKFRVAVVTEAIENKRSKKSQLK